ncbi:MAG: monovalent cation/H(+) antiporter subunit G [Cyanobacteria bacterium P01_A01_bin.135]
MVTAISYFLIGVGLVFWFWGTVPLLGDRSVLFKLHSLSISDTLGSIAIVVGLLFQIPREWPLLLLALLALTIWNTVLGYVLAYCANGSVIRGDDD